MSEVTETKTLDAAITPLLAGMAGLFQSRDAVVDVTTATSNGVYRITSATENVPSGISANAAFLIVFRFIPTAFLQVLVSYNVQGFMLRSCWYNQWSDWRKITTAAI